MSIISKIKSFFKSKPSIELQNRWIYNVNKIRNGWNIRDSSSDIGTLKALLESINNYDIYELDFGDYEPIAKAEIANKIVALETLIERCKESENENKPWEDSEIIDSILERTPSPVPDKPTDPPKPPDPGNPPKKSSLNEYFENNKDFDHLKEYSISENHNYVKWMNELDSSEFSFQKLKGESEEGRTMRLMQTAYHAGFKKGNS